MHIFDAIRKIQSGQKIMGLKLSDDKKTLIFNNGICLPVDGYSEPTVTLTEMDLRNIYDIAITKWSESVSPVSFINYLVDVLFYPEKQ